MVFGRYNNKTFEVENTGTDKVYYNIQFLIEENTFENNELIYTLTSPTGVNISETPVPLSTENIINEVLLPYNETHVYELTIRFKEESRNQNDN